jgi:hypothetical protein
MRLQVLVNTKKKRACNGQAIAEGVAILPIIVGVLIALFSIGAWYFQTYSAIMSYKQQVTFLAEELALYGGNRATGDPSADSALFGNGPDSIQAKSNIICSRMGLSPSAVVVQASEDATALTVNVAFSNLYVSSLNFEFFGKKMSQSVNLAGFSSTASALIDDSKPKYMAVIDAHTGTNGMQLYVPTYAIRGSQQGGSGLFPIGDIPNKPSIGTLETYHGGGVIYDPNGSIVASFIGADRGGPGYINYTQQGESSVAQQF